MKKNKIHHSQNPKLSLLLSQFGRQEFSDRFLEYLCQSSAMFPVVYADGDADGASKLIYEKYKKRLNIQHIEHKQNIKFVDYFTMMVKALSAIETPYVMLCDNDDFIVESGINDLVLFLEDHQDYISAGSPTLTMQVNNFSVDLHGRNSYFNTLYQYHRSIEPLSNWNDQIKETFLKFQPNFYYVFRTEALLNIWQDILNINFTDLTIMEFFFQLRTLTLGKQYTFRNNLHYVRQVGTGTFSQGYDFSDHLIRNDLPNDVRSLAKNISNHSVLGHCSSEETYESILSNYALSLNLYLPHNVLRYRFKKLFKMKVFFQTVLDKFQFLRYLNYFIKEKFLMQKLKKFYGKHKFKKIIPELQRIQNFLNSK